MHKLLGCLLIGLCLAGCGGARTATVNVAALRPTVTLTPLSTPLAYPPTPLPVGSADNPLRWVLVPDDPEAARTHQAAIETALSEVLGVQITLLLVDSPLQVIEALCDSVLSQVTLGSVDALGYAIVQARKCGVPAMRLTTQEDTGYEVVIVSLLTDELAQDFSSDTPFCRISATDSVSWIIPTLMLRALDLPDTTLGNPLNRRSYAESLKTVSAGGCWAAAVPSSLYESLRASDDDSVADLREVQTSVRLPYGVLMLPSQIPLALRDRLTTFLVTNDNDSEATPEATAETTPEADAFDRTLLESLVGAFEWQVLDDNDLALADRFFAQTRLDFAQLGQP